MIKAQLIKAPSSTEKTLKRALTDLEKTSCDIGWFETAKYPNGEPVAEIAMVHEFGRPEKGIPARPMFRPTIAKQSPVWRSILKEVSKQVLAGKNTSVLALEQLGSRVAGDITKTILEIQDPPLKESTVKARLRHLTDKTITATLRKPLVHTGVLRQTVTYVVDKK